MRPTASFSFHTFFLRGKSVPNSSICRWRLSSSVGSGKAMTRELIRRMFEMRNSKKLTRSEHDSGQRLLYPQSAIGNSEKQAVVLSEYHKTAVMLYRASNTRVLKDSHAHLPLGNTRQPQPCSSSEPHSIDVSSSLPQEEPSTPCHLPPHNERSLAFSRPSATPLTAAPSPPSPRGANKHPLHHPKKPPKTPPKSSTTCRPPPTRNHSALSPKVSPIHRLS